MDESKELVSCNLLVEILLLKDYASISTKLYFVNFLLTLYLDLRISQNNCFIVDTFNVCSLELPYIIGNQHTTIYIILNL